MGRIAALVVFVAFAVPATARASSWQSMNMPLPAGATQGFMLGVSCTAPDACTSVGYYSTAQASSGQSSSIPLVERWNGSSWKVQPTRSAGKYAGFSDVVCRSASFCVAVGWYSNTAAFGNMSPLAERWNGSAWSVMRMPNPNGFDQLTGVSCVSATACLAVGLASHSAFELGLAIAERWNGSSWSMTAPTAQLSPGATVAGFNRVACVSAVSCFAVGGEADPNPELFDHNFGLIEHWNGASWKLDSYSGVVGGQTESVDSVSCVSRVFCVAGARGFSFQLNSNTVPGAIGWNGTSWQTQNVAPLDGGGQGGFLGVSCVSPTDCTAVGDNTYGGTLAEVWNGSSWTIQSTRNPGILPTLYDVSCVGAACMAVGSYFNDLGNSQPIANDN